MTDIMRAIFLTVIAQFFCITLLASETAPSDMSKKDRNSSSSKAPIPAGKIEIVSAPTLEVKVQTAPASDEELERTFGSKKPWTGFESRSYLVALWGTILSVAALGLYYSQLTEMRKATQAAVAATQAATASLDQARTTAAAELRAWVGLDSIKIVQLEANQPLHVFTTIKNVGNSPAMNLEIKTRIMILEPHATCDPKTELESAPARMHGALFPNIERYGNLVFPGVLHPLVASEIKSGIRPLYAVGEFTYDSFGARRTTRFFMKYHPGDADFVAETTFNDAD